MRQTILIISTLHFINLMLRILKCLNLIIRPFLGESRITFQFYFQLSNLSFFQLQQEQAWNTQIQLQMKSNPFISSDHLLELQFILKRSLILHYFMKQLKSLIFQQMIILTHIQPILYYSGKEPKIQLQVSPKIIKLTFQQIILSQLPFIIRIELQFNISILNYRILILKSSLFRGNKPKSINIAILFQFSNIYVN
ncbi:unnamed protein product (macronuclear) [Paramecium tetraurelia]|uniref:Transmembrane protein n=1 Tax=Paramecium tetraurelia TaxID=5888 RepID=A0CFP9_PARTE|nr:uncharacterized protein GSPATT00038057001 [Paramecium tetraurelia]CAK69616.1 unnamed protein product [Paramecium tetraurelia]|eukprot:XP_001437013.1 hypothetical protein (macronuclear) [Paramecium tetraurelia strain d4-2]